MHKPSTLTKAVAMGAIVFINVVFSYKYLERYTSLAPWIAIAIAGFQIMVYRFRNHSFLDRPIFSVIPRIGIFILVAFTLLVHLYIPVESLNVDRWSVISSFWEAAFSHQYPYSALSHMGNPPGPLPMYFILAMPFYLLGELALFSVLGYLLWLAVVKGNRLFGTLIILSTLFMLWEVATRSNIFTNAMLVLLLLVGIEKQVEKSGHLSLLWAIPAGLLLSTRSIFALAYIPFFLFYWRQGIIKTGRLLGFTIISIAVLGLTLLPFILLFPEEWNALNPFIIQSTFLMPQEYGILFMATAIGLGFLIRQARETYFTIGFVLFLSMVVYGLYHIVTRGWQVAYLESSIDISYFIFCIPFFLYYIQKE